MTCNSCQIECLLALNVLLDGKPLGDDIDDTLLLSVSDSSDASEEVGEVFSFKIQDGMLQGRSLTFDLMRDDVVALSEFLQFVLARSRSRSSVG